MSALFSSPADQANTAAQGANTISQANIQQGEQYVNQQEQALRGAIQPGNVNPYFNAAASMSPAGYRVDPHNTTSFGSAPPQVGTTQSAPPPQGGNQFAAPQPNPFAPQRQTQPIARARAQ